MDLFVKKIQFLSWGFPVLAMPSCSRVQYYQFVAWKYRCSSSYFCFLVFLFLLLLLLLQMLLLDAVIDLSLLFFIHSSSPYIDTSGQSSMMASPLSPYFLDM